MTGFKDYTVSPHAAGQAALLGIGGIANERVARMAKRAAPFTHECGNRRFENYVLRVVDEEVVSIHEFDPQTGIVLSAGLVGA